MYEYLRSNKDFQNRSIRARPLTVFCRSPKHPAFSLLARSPICLGQNPSNHPSKHPKAMSVPGGKAAKKESNAEPPRSMYVLKYRLLLGCLACYCVNEPTAYMDG